MSQRLQLICFLISAFSLIWANEKSLAFAHVEASAEGEPCLYINLNQTYEHKMVEIQHSLVCFEYEDPYGKESTLRMNFFDWQHQLIASVEMAKKFGRNEYSMDLQQLGLPFNNQIFTLETVIENGKKLISVFKLVPPSEVPDPIVDIVVNPLTVKCGQVEGNLVEFYGSIKGGKAPYKVEWTVTNAAQSALLYQPNITTIKRPGTTPVIQVDQAPSYLVNLVVTDGCGNLGKQTVSVQCANNTEKPNSLLFQPVPSTSGQHDSSR